GRVPAPGRVAESAEQVRDLGHKPDQARGRPPVASLVRGRPGRRAPFDRRAQASLGLNTSAPRPEGLQAGPHERGVPRTRSHL
ncbi:Hypothetical predicted protein, partial [Olea europaea subsp. europaea]